jgi:hypothetical protein
VRLVDREDAAAGHVEQVFEVGVVLVGEPGDFAVRAARGARVQEGWGVLELVAEADAALGVEVAGGHALSFGVSLDDDWRLIPGWIFSWATLAGGVWGCVGIDRFGRIRLRK